MVKLIYIVLKSIELLFFFIVGSFLPKTKSNKAYWSLASCLIIVFALVEGLRFGRMIDYLSYLKLYNSSNELFMAGVEPLFSIFIFLFKETGLGFTSLMIAQAGILMYACLALLKPYKRYAKYALPLFVPLLIMNENLTRWFMACSFLYLAFERYLRKKYLSTLLWIFAAQLTHNAILPLIPVVVFYPLYNKVILPRSVVLVFFVVMSLFSNINNATFIVTISDFLLENGLISEESSMAAHLVHAEDLIQGEYLELGIMQKSLFQKMLDMIIWIPIIWFSHTYACEKNIRGIYNVMAVSLILSPLFTQVELLNRYTMYMNVLSVALVGIYYYHELKGKKKYRYAIALLSLMLFMYPAISLIFNRGEPSDMLFIWDNF